MASSRAASTSKASPSRASTRVRFFFQNNSCKFDEFEPFLRSNQWILNKVCTFWTNFTFEKNKNLQAASREASKEAREVFFSSFLNAKLLFEIDDEIYSKLLQMREQYCLRTTTKFCFDAHPFSYVIFDAHQFSNVILIFYFYFDFQMTKVILHFFMWLIACVRFYTLSSHQ